MIPKRRLLAAFEVGNQNAVAGGMGRSRTLDLAGEGRAPVEVGMADAPGCDGCKGEDTVVVNPHEGLVAESYLSACLWKVVGNVAAARLNHFSSPLEALVVAVRSLEEDGDNHAKVPS
jgi:hypothetical protein